ncbi:hypothetical protein ACE1CC_03495 [Aerosakkonemataceae cyanobacterium BLCC-F46]|uniref:Peptidase metallopeptidase domain-containing protein n=1 Tax=Floridaenema aerugineum BLCC-F46 TaxID=3153654 RepID=A0ABV4X132_9CYAN
MTLIFDITPATKFQDSVSPQEWRATVFSWDGSQGSAPPINFWEGDFNNPNTIGVINLGSNTRSDGKQGINVDWGNGAPNGDGNRLPHDFFAMRAYTVADFDGSEYKFRVRGDDGFQILAKQHGTNQWFYITPQNQWTQAYGSHNEITSTLPAGRYDLHFHQYEASGNAYLDLSWEKVNSQPVFDINYTSVPNNARTVVDDAIRTWESKIRRGPIGSPVERGFQVAITTEELGNLIYADCNYAENGVASLRLDPEFFGKSYSQQKKIIMHELGHAMGFGQQRLPQYDRLALRNQSDGHWYFMGTNAIALYGGPVPLQENVDVNNINYRTEGGYHWAEGDARLRLDLMSAATLEGYSDSNLSFTVAALKDMGFDTV